MQAPFVSVIIPVLNDSKRLVLCVEALERQTYPREQYEIIVVDNGSSEDVEPCLRPFDRVVLAHEPAPGPAAARNKGIALARGEVLAFTDSDCIPDEDWIEKGARSLLTHPYCGMAAGGIDFMFSNPARPTVCELYDSMMYLQQRRYVEKRRFGATANLFTLKSVIDDVGLFDDVTYNLSACEDTDWGWRVFDKGYKQIYAQEARVRHPARHEFRELYKKLIRTIEGRASFENKWSVSKRTSERLGAWRDNVNWSLNRAAIIVKEPGLKGKRVGLLFLALFLLIVRLMMVMRFSMLKYKKA